MACQLWRCVLFAAALVLRSPNRSYTNHIDSYLIRDAKPAVLSRIRRKSFMAMSPVFSTLHRLCNPITPEEDP